VRFEIQSLEDEFGFCFGSLQLAYIFAHTGFILDDTDEDDEEDDDLPTVKPTDSPTTRPHTNKIATTITAMR